MVWNITKEDIRVRMAVVEEHTWAPPLAGEAKLAQKDDKEQFSKNTGIPLEALLYSDFVKKGRWSEVDDPLRKIYAEASEAMGREFEYPKKD